MADSKKVNGTSVDEKSKKKVVNINDPEIVELRKKYEETQKEIKKTEEEIKKLEAERAEQGKDKLQLAELINIAIKFIRNEITAEELNEFGKKMTIRGYIPMMEKLRLLSSLVFELNNLTNINELGVINLHRALFYDVLLGGYAFVDVTENIDGDKLRTYANMDLLYPLFTPFILQYCRQDYEEFVHMVEMTINIYHMEDLTKILSSVDYNTIKDTVKRNEELISNLEKNKDLIKDLKDIVVTTSPANDTINTIMQTGAIAEANEKLASEKEKEEVKEEVKENTKEDTKENTKEDIKESEEEKKEKPKSRSTRGRPKKSK